MHAITLLQLQRRRTDRVNVHLDDEFAFSLALDLAAGLRLGQVLDDSEIRALKEEDGYRVALDRGATYLQARPRSIDEVRRRLVEKECEPDAIERALSRMVELGYVDDSAFSKWWVANRLQHKPRGRFALRSELRLCGVSDDDIDDALRDVEDETVAVGLAGERARRFQGDDRAAFDSWIGSYLKRRGFGSSTIRGALDAAWRGIGAEER